VRTAGSRSGGWADGAALLAFAVLTAYPPQRLLAQDTSAIDRGVRIGIVYRPGVRPGMVVLPDRSTTLDSARAILTRDLDYSDRFEMITLPGGDSIRLSAPPATRSGHAGAPAHTGAAALGLNYPLYQALGADFAIAVGLAGDTIQLTVHDVAGGAVRRTLNTRLPSLTDPRFRMDVHRLADRIVEAALGTPGSAATRILFVIDGNLYRIDQDGAGLTEVRSGGDRAILAPAWDRDGRRITYMDFWSGHGQLFVQDAATGRRRAVTDGTTLDFTPAFSPDGKTLVFSRAIEEGTDVYAFNLKDNCCLQRLTVGRFSDNLSPTYSPDGQRIAFVSTRAGLPQIYVMAPDGTDQQLFAPFDYGVTGSSNAPDWSPDGQSVIFHRDVAGTLQVFVLDARTRTVRQLTSLGRNEDPTWAPDSRHAAFVSDRSGFRQLWVIDMETGRIRPLLQQSGIRLPAWSPRLPEAAPSTP
jgi:TolB protein